MSRKNEFKINKIATYLKKHKKDLEALYIWEPKYDEIINLIEIRGADKEKLKLKVLKPFEKDELLKDILSSKLKRVDKSSEEFKKVAIWIIRGWGGIHGGTDDNTMKAVYNFFNDKEPQFDRIASASKVGGLLYPEKYIIYDSRVAYTVNWILLSENAGNKYFPIPEGRNTKMNAFNMETLIHLKNIDRFQYIDKPGRNFISGIDAELFIPKDGAYNVMNDLIKQVNEKLWTNERKNQPFYTEMLLFALADTVVFEEIITHYNNF